MTMLKVNKLPNKARHCDVSRAFTALNFLQYYVLASGSMPGYCDAN